MKIAICGPVSLHLLSDLVNESTLNLPTGYQYPLAAYLARLLHGKGHEIALVTSSAQASKTEIWRGERMTIYHTPRRRFFRFTLDAYARERRSLIQALQDYKPDIIHAQWTYEFAHAAIDSGFPTLVTARDAPWTILRHMKTPYRFYRALYAHYVIPRIKRMSAISDYVIDRICKEYSYRSKIKLIPNGLSKELFVLEIPRQEYHDSLSFISVTGWDPRKNVKTLLRAFKQLRQELPEARMTLIGRGLGDTEIGANWARQQDCASGVVFGGALSQQDVLHALRTEGGIFVHATLEESFCMTVLEAMAQGLPVVVLPDSGAVPWLVGDGAAGIIAKSQSSESLSLAMLMVAKDVNLRQRLAVAGYDRALSMFDLETVADRYLEEYQATIQYYASKI